jgi:hypothetical protein
MDARVLSLSESLLNTLRGFSLNIWFKVMLSSVVTHSPSCKVAPAALLELSMACDLFERAAAHGGRAKKFLVRESPYDLSFR